MELAKAKMIDKVQDNETDLSWNVQGTQKSKGGFPLSRNFNVRNGRKRKHRKWKAYIYI